MLGHARELEKNMIYAYPDWDSAMMRVKSIKKGKAGVVITHQNGKRVQLDNLAAVRFFELGKEP